MCGLPLGLTDDGPANMVLISALLVSLFGEGRDALGDWFVFASDALLSYLAVFGYDLNEYESPAQPMCDLSYGS